MKISARNQIKGTVVGVKAGPVNSTVSVDIGGGNVLTSMITTDSVIELELVESKPVTVVVKATDVLIGID